MKALLLKKWGGNYAGQVLTNVEAGSIPADVAKFYKDDEPTPNDVVKDPQPDGAPLTVTNDTINPDDVKTVEDAQKGKLEAADKAAEAVKAKEVKDAHDVAAAANPNP